MLGAQDFFSQHPVLSGPEIIQTPYIQPTEVRHDIPLVRFPHSANHREWKRLVRERRKLAKLITRQDALCIGNKMYMTPAMVDALRREMAARADRVLERSFRFGGW